MRLLGIDPGTTGAVAIYDDVTRDLEVHDLPTTTVTKAGKSKTSLNLPAVLELLKSLKADHAFMEAVHTMPGQGVVSSGTFMRCAGQLDMGVAASGIPLTYVSPVVWKKRLQVRGEKDASVARAIQLFPTRASLFSLKKHHNRADASLIAYFASLVVDSPF